MLQRRNQNSGLDSLVPVSNLNHRARLPPSKSSPEDKTSLSCVHCIYFCDIVIYNKRYIFGLCPDFGIGLLKLLKFPKC